MQWRTAVSAICFVLMSASFANGQSKCDPRVVKCDLENDFNTNIEVIDVKPKYEPPKVVLETKPKDEPPEVDIVIKPKYVPPKVIVKKKPKYVPPKIVVLQKPAAATKVVRSSWDGLPEIPVSMLLAEDMTDIAGQYIVDLDSKAFAAAGLDLKTIPLNDLAKKLGVEVWQIRSIQRRFLFSAILHISPEQAQTLRKNPLVKNIGADTKIKAAGGVQILSWGLDRLDGPSLPTDGKFDRDFGDYETRVYLFDTGVERSRKEFGGRVKLGASFVAPLPHMTEKCRAHGTEMASLIVGETTGSAPKAEIVELIVLPCQRNQTGSASSLIEAIEWLLIREEDFGDGKPAVASMSLAGKWSRSINNAVAVLTENGVAVVVAAGNNAQDACRYSPASARDAITVAATGPKDETPGFSNFGQCIDIHAPGRLLTAITEDQTTPYVAINGTSGAAALVSGLLARSLTSKGPKAASQWLVDAAAPAKFWRKDQKDVFLAQTNQHWRKRCRTATIGDNLKLRIRPSLAAKTTLTVTADMAVTIEELIPNWARVNVPNLGEGWLTIRDQSQLKLLQPGSDLPCQALQ